MEQARSRLPGRIRYRYKGREVPTRKALASITPPLITGQATLCHHIRACFVQEAFVGHASGKPSSVLATFLLNTDDPQLTMVYGFHLYNGAKVKNTW